MYRTFSIYPFMNWIEIALRIMRGSEIFDEHSGASRAQHPLGSSRGFFVRTVMRRLALDGGGSRLPGISFCEQSHLAHRFV